ncbi:hypothetical protein K474DRAFT_1712901 [Panus rudis PR-1116 ss-1]|nr:hypothetical protein K474DRAFT_1712901 [Panus rudis PR-1116 ss-1]
MPVIDSPRVPAEDRLRVLDIPSRVETDNNADNECDESREDEEDEIEGEDEDEADGDDDEGEGDGDDDAADEEFGPEDGEDDYGDGEKDYEAFAPLDATYNAMQAGKRSTSALSANSAPFYVVAFVVSVPARIKSRKAYGRTLPAQVFRQVTQSEAQEWRRYETTADNRRPVVVDATENDIGLFL